MTKKEAKERMEKLRSEIDYHRYRYHVLDDPEISDGAWDALKNELARLEQEYPEFITPDSPTQRVGGKPLEKFEKVEHDTPMTSLYDAFSREDMRDWEERVKKLVPGQKPDYYTELKLDGLAVSLKYSRGRFRLGATRGDGRVGENVTANLKTIEAIPMRLRVPEAGELKEAGLKQDAIKAIRKAVREGDIEARGEALMTKQVFKELNRKYAREGRAELANPRNGAAGSIRQLDPKLAAERSWISIYMRL
jgi:NAD-dependent DNA ligase (contains BRCT domain type II)